MAASTPPATADPQSHILRTAYRLMSQRGVQRVSLEAVAGASGVSKSLVLYYFKTRENLILQMMEWVLGQVAARIRDQTRSAASPRDQVRLMLDVIFAGPQINRRFYLTYLELAEHAARFERFAALSAAYREREDRLYAELVRQGVEAGAFQVADVETTAMVLRAIVEGLFVQWLQEPDGEATHGRYREMCEQAVLVQLGVR